METVYVRDVQENPVDRKQLPTTVPSPGFHHVAARVKAARRAIGFSRYRLARAAGIAVSSLHELEEGLTADMKLSTLLGLCQALHCSPDFLLGINATRAWAQGFIRPPADQNEEAA
jgi:transcriptional regulator with XRE-family HTH domain